MKQLFMLFAFFTGTISIYAQTGKIKGIITIPESNKGALVNIGLNGTSKGTMSKPDGSYEIRQVPPGTYTLEFSYIGLQKKQV